MNHLTREAPPNNAMQLTGRPGTHLAVLGKRPVNRTFR